jgi:hypothetical protein
VESDQSMDDVLHIKDRPICRAAMRPIREDYGRVAINPFLYERFSNDAAELWGLYDSESKEDLQQCLRRLAVSYEILDVDITTLSFEIGAPIREFLAETAEVLFQDEDISISLTNFIDSLCRLSLQWVDYFFQAPPFADAISRFLHSDVSGLSLNALRIHHWIWKFQIQQRDPLDIRQLCANIAQIPNRTVDHAIQMAYILRTFASLCAEHCHMAKFIANLLADLLNTYPCAKVIYAVTYAGKKLINKGQGKALVAPSLLQSAFTRALVRSFEIGHQEFHRGDSSFPVASFELVYELMRLLPAESVPFFESIPLATHMAMLSASEAADVENYLKIGIELIRTSECPVKYLEDPVFFVFLRNLCLNFCSLPQSIWLKFCCLLLFRRGPSVLELLLSNSVIKECLLALEDEIWRFYYFLMIARIWNIQSAYHQKNEEIMSLIQKPDYQPMIGELSELSTCKLEIGPDETIDLIEEARGLLEHWKGSS